MNVSTARIWSGRALLTHAVSFCTSLAAACGVGEASLAVGGVALDTFAGTIVLAA